jgi:hypothetical protein
VAVVALRPLRPRRAGGGNRSEATPTPHDGSQREPFHLLMRLPGMVSGLSQDGLLH